MNKAMKKRWVAALRSGDYQQTQNRLHALDGSMCCLGVLCDIEIDGDWEILGHGYNIKGRSGGLPKSLQRQGRLSMDEHGTLTYLNDAKAKNFAEIADFIEENL